MGTTAKADVKSVLSMATAYNMDSIDALTLQKLGELVGMNTAVGGTGAAAKAYTDASSSKALSSFTTTAAGTTVLYTYRRGDVTLQCELNLSTQEEKWTCTLTDAKRFDALAQGLKINGTTKGTSGTTGTVPSAVGTVGQLGYAATINWPK